MRAVVIGVGNRYRSDDGAGPAVADRVDGLRLPGVSVVEHDGEPSRLLDSWEGFDLAVVVDAVHSHAGPPGSVHRVEVDDGAGTAYGVVAGPPSSHGLGPGDAIALARALGRLPRQLVIFGIEGENFGHGVGFSTAVAGALDGVVTAIDELVTRTRTGEVEDGHDHHR